MERELIDAIGDYLRAHTERQGHAHTAEAFGVSRHTLWRFLERSRPGLALPRAVMAEAGDTAEAIRTATHALTGEAEAAPKDRPDPSLPRPLRETLLALCAAPFASVDELASFERVPASTLRARLSQLQGRGLADKRPHRLAALGARPQLRYLPTAAGVAAAGEVDDALRLYPVSRQWFRLLGERLDAVAVTYALAAIIAEADPEQDPVRVDHYRHGPYDALVTLSGGRSFGLVRQGPMLTPASLRYRIRSIERLQAGERPLVTLIATDSDQDRRRAVRALRESWGFHHCAVATLGDVLAGGAWARVWQPERSGTGDAPELIAPDVSLAGRVDVAARLAEHPVHARFPGPHPGRVYRGRMRATPPGADERPGDVLATQLTAAGKQALDLLAGWPLCTTEQLSGLMGAVSDRRVNQVLRPLRERGLVRRDGSALVLTDEGVTVLARRDRAAVGATLDRWSSVRDGSGRYAGTALRALVSQREHWEGILQFVFMLGIETTFRQGYELLDLLPTHRSQITYRQRGTNYALHPDASFQLGCEGSFRWCLLEYERRATTPRRIPERLASYRRYFGSGYPLRDHGGQEPLVLFVFETDHAARVFLREAADLPGVPLASATTDSLDRHGVLGPAWSRPAPHAPERCSLAFLAWGDTLSKGRAGDFR